MVPKHKPKAVVIGSGVGGLGVAALLAHDGYDVDIFEKNEQAGGRASVLEADGFRFDMGPSWYLMPDVFEHFFARLGERVADHLTLQRLSPSYRVFFAGEPEGWDFHSDVARDRAAFERLEPGSGQALDRYLRQAGDAYEAARQWFLYRNYDSVWDFFDRRALAAGRRFTVFSSMGRLVARFFRSERVRQVMEYQLVFLGGSPSNTPALYQFMNHIDFAQGVFYPLGGFGDVIKALVRLALRRGARLHLQAPVHRILVEAGKAAGVLLADGTRVPADLVISNADYAFTEGVLLERPYRVHDDAYWERRVMAPSALILYLGVKGRLPGLAHHNLLLSEPWEPHFREIFGDPRWPTDPSLYVCAPSVTDPSVAPAGHENLFVLVPIAAGLPHAAADVDWYKEKILLRLERCLRLPDLRERLVFQKAFCLRDFQERYHSYKGSALGFAHTLGQTAAFRPNNVSKKVRGLYFVGAGTNPGIGVPTCLVSAELAYKRIKGIRTPTP